MMRTPKVFKDFTQAVVVSVIVAWIQPVQAQLRQTYPASDAIEGSVSVTVWPGSGTNIDFSDLGESIYRIWLDDPSRITVDTDNDLLDGGGAQIIHLRRIEGVDFAGLPATPQTLLTVATVNQARQTTLYQFPVFYSTGSPTYSTIALTLPPAPMTPEPRLQVAAAPLGGVPLDTLLVGLDAFIQDGEITADGPLASRVEEFVGLVRNGSSSTAAAAAVSINIQVIETLVARGLAEEAAHSRAIMLEQLQLDAGAGSSAAEDSSVPVFEVPLPAFEVPPFEGEMTDWPWDFPLWPSDIIPGPLIPWTP